MSQNPEAPSSNPAPVPAWRAHLVSAAAGLIAAAALHYILYRIGMPSQPFIYVAF